MEMSYLINGVLTIFISVIGWLLRKKDDDQEQKITLMRQMIDKNADALSSLPKEYVLKDDFKEDLKIIRCELNRVEERLDQKEDKQW
jgi:hypothetical protein